MEIHSIIDHMKQADVLYQASLLLVYEELAAFSCDNSLSGEARGLFVSVSEQLERLGIIKIKEAPVTLEGLSTKTLLLLVALSHDAHAIQEQIAKYQSDPLVQGISGSPVLLKGLYNRLKAVISAAENARHSLVSTRNPTVLTIVK